MDGYIENMKKTELHSEQTKLALSESLKRLVIKTGGRRITVNMIADDCGINRNTFYYHFPNISALLQWTFSREALAISEKMDFLTDLQNAVDFTMNYIDSNRELCSFAYRQIDSMYLKHIFGKEFNRIIDIVIEKILSEEKLEISADFRKFLIANYTELIASLLIRYVDEDTGIQQCRNGKFCGNIYDYINVMFMVSLKAVVREGGERKL